MTLTKVLFVCILDSFSFVLGRGFAQLFDKSYPDFVENCRLKLLRVSLVNEVLRDYVSG